MATGLTYWDEDRGIEATEISGELTRHYVESLGYTQLLIDGVPVEHVLTVNFDPSQPRDSHGRWGSGDIVTYKGEQYTITGKQKPHPGGSQYHDVQIKHTVTGKSKWTRPGSLEYHKPGELSTAPVAPVAPVAPTSHIPVLVQTPEPYGVPTLMPPDTLKSYLQRSVVPANSKVTAEELREKTERLEGILSRMTPTARLAAQVGCGRITIHSSIASVSKEWNAIGGAKGDYADVVKVNGFYRPSHYAMQFDGGPIASGTAAHELGHAIDRLDVHSNSPAWRSAYDAEINTGGNNPPLSAYARTNSSEGFAEFSRLLYSYDEQTSRTMGRGRDVIQQKFPQCYAYWQSQGLV